MSNTVKEVQNSKLGHKHAPFLAFITLPLGEREVYTNTGYHLCRTNFIC